MKTPTIELCGKLYGIRVFKGFDKLRLADNHLEETQKDLKMHLLKLSFKEL